MTIENLIAYGKKYVHKDQVFLLLSTLLNLNFLEVYNHLEDKVSDNFIKEYKKKIDMLKCGKPIQYVIGNVNFLGYNFNIDENVLIPRFETELLVEKCSQFIKEKLNNNKIKVVDLGTGSGVIGLTLKKLNPSIDLDLIDISISALNVAKKNADNLNIKCNIKQNDFLDNIDEKYDIVISNPPYIKTNEYVEDIVKNNEPHQALYAGEDGLDCYKKILKNIQKNLKEKYLIAFEIGMTQQNDLKKLKDVYLKEAKFICFKDLNNLDRIVFITNIE